MKEFISYLNSIGYNLVWSELCGAYHVFYRDSLRCTFLPSIVFSALKDYGLNYGVGYDCINKHLYIKFF